MRIAFLCSPLSPNGWYRGIGPMLALAGRGHTIRQLLRTDGVFRPELVDGCDVLHIHRDHDDETLQLVKRAKEEGIAVVWDNDDDLASVPRNNVAARTYRGASGAKGFANARKIIELADLVTAPSARLAEIHREQGAQRSEVIENYVRDEMALYRRPEKGDRAPVVIGWMAGKEHHVDAERIPIRAVLQRLLAEHEQIEVHTIGVGLGLRSERYKHTRAVLFARLEEVLSPLDVGLAPISDMTFNRSRSNVKLKEYASIGVPWLASPIGPYAEMGEKQGGRLVPDDAWHDALDRLIVKERDRRKLAKRAHKWGRAQSVSANAGEWERRLAALSN